MYNFLCSDSLLYTSFFFFILYMVFIHVMVHAEGREPDNDAGFPKHNIIAS